MKEFLAKIENGYTEIQVFWMFVAQERKCIYCKTRFPDGIVNKHPGVSKFSIDSRFWFTQDFLAHLHATHGLHHEAMTSFLEMMEENETLTPVPEVAE